MKTFRCGPLAFGILACFALTISSAAVHADTFGSGDHVFDIEFVTIGDPGNAPDTVAPTATSAPLPGGSVDYTYRMATYEISEEIIAKANALSDAAGASLNLNIDVQRGPQKPATGLSWYDAARFVNFLNEDHGSPAAYKFDEQNRFQLWAQGDVGYDPDNLYRNARARYFMPSADEWHKAAYYDPDNDRFWLYPYGSDDPPIPVASGTDPGTAVYNQDGPADVQMAGGENLFGLLGMAGNVSDWEETHVSLTSDSLINDSVDGRRGASGGGWIFTISPVGHSSAFRNSAGARATPGRVGIRIASIPEPTTLPSRRDADSQCKSRPQKTGCFPSLPTG